MANMNKKLCQVGLLAGCLIIGTVIATGIGIGISSLKLPLWASTLIGMAICYGFIGIASMGAESILCLRGQATSVI